MHACQRHGLAVLLAGITVVTPAGAGSSTFDVHITLTAYSPALQAAGSICTSGATSGSADATISVVCSGNEFVSIEPGQGAATQRRTKSGSGGPPSSSAEQTYSRNG